MMDKFKNSVIFILFAAVVVLLLMRGCIFNKKDTSVGKIDTLITVRIDTVYAKQDTHKIFIEVKEPILTFIDTSDKSPCNIINVYRDSLSDNNLVIHYSDSIKGKILKKDMFYKLKVPVLITTTITETITKEIEVKKEPKLALYGGFTLGVTNKYDIANFGPTLNLRVKNNLIGYTYGLKDNSHNVGVSIKLFNKK